MNLDENGVGDLGARFLAEVRRPPPNGGSTTLTRCSPQALWLNLTLFALSLRDNGEQDRA